MELLLNGHSTRFTRSIFELRKYMRGKLGAERELQAMQYITGLGTEREEFHDEIFIQCIRQTTNNLYSECNDKLRWDLLAWFVTCERSEFQSLILRYYVSFLKKSLETLDGKLRQHAQWCFDNCKCTKVSSRLFPPSSVEIAWSFKTQGTDRRQWPPSREEIFCTVNRRPCYARFYFMDGQFYFTEFHPISTALEVMNAITKYWETPKGAFCLKKSWRTVNPIKQN
uniref:MyTH4 domain-containing protein n=1 Tax=Glossina palpalis gambiensis TaxID=67801 RepID=A0A1B0B235_9MUSC